MASAPASSRPASVSSYSSRRGRREYGVARASPSSSSWRSRFVSTLGADHLAVPASWSPREQDRVGAAQLAVLLLQRLQPLRLTSADPTGHPVVDVGLGDPLASVPLSGSSALNDCSKPLHQLGIVVAILVANKPAIAAPTAAASPIGDRLVDTPPAPAGSESTALTLVEVVELKVSMACAAPARDDYLLLLPGRPVIQRIEVPGRELTGEPVVAVVPRLVRRVVESAGVHDHHSRPGYSPCGRRCGERGAEARVWFAGRGRRRLTIVGQWWLGERL